MVAHRATKPNPIAKSFPGKWISINTLILDLRPFVSDLQSAFINIAASEYGFGELGIKTFHVHIFQMEVFNKSFIKGETCLLVSFLKDKN